MVTPAPTAGLFATDRCRSVTQLPGHPDTLAFTFKGSALIEPLKNILDVFAGMDCGGFVDHPRLFVPDIETGVAGAPLPQKGMPLGQDGFDPVLKTTLFKKFETIGIEPATRNPLS